MISMSSLPLLIIAFLLPQLIHETSNPATSMSRVSLNLCTNCTGSFSMNERTLYVCAHSIILFLNSESFIRFLFYRIPS